MSEVSLSFVLKEVTHSDVVNLSVCLVDIGDRLGDLGVSGCVTLYIGPDALTMEGVLAGVDEELTIVKDCSEADIAVLSWVDHDMPVLLVTPL